MELTEHQRLFLTTSCDYFHRNGKWPTYGFLDHALDDQEDLDVLVIGQELAQFMNESWGRPMSGWDPTVQAYLTVPALYSCLSDGICPELSEDLDAFMQVVRLCIEKYRSGEENARITEAEVRDRFGMSDLMLRKVFLLVTSTGLSGGSGSNPTDSGDQLDWYITLSPYTRNYKRVKTIEDYLAMRSKLQAQASAAYPVMPLPLRHGYSPLGGYAAPDEEVMSAGSLADASADSGAVVPLELVEGTRDYIVIVARQINETCEVSCYDACAVMIRRLVETLIIEVYEARSIESRIVDPSTGDYCALSKLIDKVKVERTLPLSRNTKKALRELKDVGDLAAHNRRFNAVREYIDELKLGLRVVVQELVYLMRPANTTST